VYEGPPFKFKATKSEHTRYCQVVRYSPDGSHWVSGGFDGKLFLYDGKESGLKHEFSGHTGGVYGVAWENTNRKFFSASGDKTCKLWDVETAKCITTFNMGKDVEDQQVSCLWSGHHMLSVSLSGFINYLDPNNPDKPLQVLKGHNKPITSCELSADKHSIYTGASDGTVTAWDSEKGSAQRVQGKGHGVQVTDINCAGTGSVFTCGFDDTVRVFEPHSLEYTDTTHSLSAQPRSMEHKGDLTIVATMKSLVLMRGGLVVHEEKVEYEPSSCSYSTVHNHVCVGEAGGNMLRVYNVNGAALDLIKEVQLSGPVTDVKYSPDQSHVVTSDGNRKGPTLDFAEREGEESTVLMKVIIQNCYLSRSNRLTFVNLAFLRRIKKS